MRKETSEVQCLFMPEPNLKTENTNMMVLDDAIEYLKEFDRGDQLIKSIFVKVEMMTPVQETKNKKPMTIKEREKELESRSDMMTFLLPYMGKMLSEQEKKVFIDQFVSRAINNYGRTRVVAILKTNPGDIQDHRIVNVGMINDLMYHLHIDTMMDVHGHQYLIRSSL